MSAKEELCILLANAVQAKLDYWDANGALEHALMNGEDISDHDADALEENIALLAAGANSGSDIGIEHVDYVIEDLTDLPTD